MKILMITLLLVVAVFWLFLAPTIERGDVVVSKREFSLRSGYRWDDGFVCRLSEKEKARVISTSLILHGAAGGRQNVVEVVSLASGCSGWAPVNWFK